MGFKVGEKTGVRRAAEALEVRGWRQEEKTFEV
jgi:hypothetical protein